MRLSIIVFNSSTLLGILIFQIQAICSKFFERCEKKTVGCGIAAESYYLMLQDINCKQIYYVISPFSFITTKIVMPHEGLEHRTSCTLSENLTSGPYQTLLSMSYCSTYKQIGKRSIKNKLCDRSLSRNTFILLFTTVSLDRLEFDSQDVFNNPSGSFCIKTTSPRWRKEESITEPNAPSARIISMIQQTL